METFRMFYLKTQFLVVKFSIYSNRRVFLMMWTTKPLIRLRGRADRFESSLGAHVRRYIFSLCGSTLISTIKEQRRGAGNGGGEGSTTPNVRAKATY